MSRSLRNTGDDRPPKPQSPFGVFPGSGPSKFGAFAQNATRSVREGATDGLLPHEIQARKQAPALPVKPVRPPHTKAPQRNRLEPLNSTAPDRNAKQRPDQRQRSNSLSDLFGSNRTPKAIRTPPSWSTGTDPKPLPDLKNGLKPPSDQSKGPRASQVDRSKPHWGLFRNKAVDNPVPSPKNIADAWDALEDKVRKHEERKKPTAPAKTWRNSRENSRAAPRPSAHAVTNTEAWTPNTRVADEPESASTRRSSRFDDGEDESPGSQGTTKSKKTKKRDRASIGNRARMESLEEDEDYWNSRSRRQAEKQARKAAAAQEPVEPTAVPIFLPEYISISDLARALKQQERSFLNDLEEMGFENLTDDTIMTGETAALIAGEYGFEPTVDDGAQRDLRPRPPPEDISVIDERPPVVTIMGHVDHGKTTLLDYLRKSSVAAQEHGGITQHIGAFVVQMSSGKPITFLDTPGHAAFLTMRQRGANVTDIVVLVVAADDSVKPQTLEALKHARAAKVPIIVAINKVDKPDARINEVKADLSRHGVEIEDYGGDVQVVCVSGKTGQGMDDLEENITTLSEILDVRAEKDGMAEGWILESSIKQDGRVATILVKRGTLKVGDIIVAGQTFAKIRLMRNEAGAEVFEAPPGTPVEILGWRELPEAGEQILQAPDESKARMAIEYRQDLTDREQLSKQLAEQEQRERDKATEKAAQQAAEDAGLDPDAKADGQTTMLNQNFVIKADVAGSVEALVSTVLEQGNNEVQGKVLRSGAGQVTESDVDLAATSGSIIINFNSAILPHVKDQAADAKVRIIDQSVIYHVVDDVRAALSDLLPPLVTHRVIGEAEILQTFDIQLKGKRTRKIAGCRVRNGSIKKGAHVKILRFGSVLHDGLSPCLPLYMNDKSSLTVRHLSGKIDTLKQVKKDVNEMGKGTECGIGFEGFEDLLMSDQIQTYEVVKEKRTL